MAEFDITDTRTLPANTTSVTAKITLSKSGESDIIRTLTVPVDDEPDILYQYSGSLREVGHVNNVAYQADYDNIIEEGFEVPLNPGKPIAFDFRAAANQAGVRIQPTGGAEDDEDYDGDGNTTEPSEYMQLYADQPWTLTIESTDGTSTKWTYNFFKFVRTSGAGGTLKVNELDQSNSDIWPVAPDCTSENEDGNCDDPLWQYWGENPNFILQAGGQTQQAPDAEADSWSSLRTRIALVDDTGRVDLEGNVYTIQNEWELETYLQGIDINQSITLHNGSISGGFNPNLLTWERVGDTSLGVYKASFPDEIVNAVDDEGNRIFPLLKYSRFQLVDLDQSNSPNENPNYQIRNSRHNTAPFTGPANVPQTPLGTQFDPHRFTWTGDWLTWESRNTSGDFSGLPCDPADDESAPTWKEGDQGWHRDDGFRVEREPCAKLDDPVLSICIADNVEGRALLAQMNEATYGAFEEGSDKWRDLTVLLHTYPNLIAISNITWERIAADDLLRTSFRTPAQIEAGDTPAGDGIGIIGRITFKPYDYDSVNFPYGANTIRYNQYFKFAFHGVGLHADDGIENNLNEGEYVWDTTQNVLFYRPVDSTTIENYIISDSNGGGDGEEIVPVPGVYIPAVGRLFQLSNGADVTLEGLDIFCQHGNNDNAYFITGPSNDTTEKIRFEGCRTFATWELTKDVILIAYESKFLNSVKRFCTCKRCDIQRCYWGTSYNQSVINVNGDWDDQTPGAHEPTIIKDNFFTLEASAHGQCVATYNSNWQNVIIEHNIFYNCKAVQSYQVTSNDASGIDQKNGDRGNPGEYRFANNLVYMNNLAVVPVSQGQTGLAYNGRPDYHNGPEQKVNWLSNTIWTDTTYENEANAVENHINKMQLSLGKHTTCDLIVANNIARSVRQTDTASFAYYYGYYGVTPTDDRATARTKYEADSGYGAEAFQAYNDDELKYGGGSDSLRVVLPREPIASVSVCNAIYGRNTQTASDSENRGLGRSDMPDLPYKDFAGGAIDPTGVFDEETLQPLGDWATSASDGGRIGIRWSSIPTVAQLEEINENKEFDWTDRFPALPYPVPQDNDGDGINDRITSSAGDTYIFNESDRVIENTDNRQSP